MIARQSVSWTGGFLLAVGVVIGGSSAASGTALDDYIAAPDPNFGWTKVYTVNGSGYKGHILDMTSQVWRDEPNEVNRELWQHWVRIIKPTTVSSTRALLYIGGGSNGGSIPTSVDSMLRAIATATHSVVAEVRMVPNQRIAFADEPDPTYIPNGRTEDELIAYAWDKYLRTGDAIWLPRLPMTNAAVLAMDATQAFMADPNYISPPVTINDFVVSGASKRGWTTWTTAAVDPRVVAIVPIVIDVLNVEISMTHHYAAYGFWAPAVHDYEDMGNMNWFQTPEIGAMFDIIDPYAYRARYTMPKFLLNSAGDDFFLPDSSQFYFDDLPGEKYLRYVPNTDHSLDGSDAADSLLAFYEAILNGTPRPQFSWSLVGDDSIHAQTDPNTAPTQVKLWQATNTVARDFRKNPVGMPYSGPVWTSTTLSDLGSGLYVGQVPMPSSGWRAFFVEMTYPSGGSAPFKFTTEVRVVPDPATLTIDVHNELWGRVVEVDPNFPRYYQPGTPVTLTAEPTPGRSFNNWRIYDPNHPGDANYAATDTNSVITLTMSSDRHVEAAFKCGSSTGQAILPLIVVAAVCGFASRRRR